MPGGRYISRERTSRTNYIQKKDGRLAGRKRVKGKGDGTGVRRVKRDFVLVKESKGKRGHVRKTRKTFNAGQIVGRF